MAGASAVKGIHHGGQHRLATADDVSKVPLRLDAAQRGQQHVQVGWHEEEQRALCSREPDPHTWGRDAAGNRAGATPCANTGATAAARAAGRCRSASEHVTSVAPDVSVWKSSHSDTPKTYCVLNGTASPAPMGYVRRSQLMRLSSGPCVTTTPLGLPVEPDVYMT